MNMFKYSNTNKRYHTLDYYYKNKYAQKVYKISLNAGFGCPNNPRCIYCSEGSKYFNLSSKVPLKKQFIEGIKLISKKIKKPLYIAYFQTNTNTYAPLSILKEKYEEVLTYPNVIGLSIATRSDAISNDVLYYLTDLNKRTDLTIELGLQSIHSKTLKLIKRGHTLKNFTNMVKKLQQRNIKVVVHIINGLPYETKEDMLATVKYLNKLKINGIKIHMLHIIKNTELAKMYQKEKFHILTKDEYIDIVCDELELLDEKIIIHRITGDPKIDNLITPTWLIKKFCVLNDIDKEMVKRNSYQGIKKED
ncbi:MAG TPA: TIGR01212 family radical SAM protein [Bacilli bacterium]|nr:TIGR01212 family radical SAM protein [Bacilli bacterium]